MKPALLFDLDGVLADSTRPIVDCVNDALEALGIEPKSEEAITAIVGPPTEIGFAQLLGVAPDDPLIERAVEEYRARYVTGLQATPTYPGVPEVVRTLAQTHLLGVATSKPRRFAVPVLETIGIASLFAYVAGPEPDGPADKRTMVAEAIQALPSATAMIGDRSLDVEAAHAHGLRAVAVTWGFGDREELAAADVIVDRPDDLLTAAVSA